MSESLILPWLIGGVPSAAKNALTALNSLDTSAQRTIGDAIRALDLPYTNKKLRDTAKRLHGELRVLDEETLYHILDALTDLIRVPANYLPDILGSIFKDASFSLRSLEELVQAVASDASYVRQKAIQEFKERALSRLGSVEYFCAMRTRFDKDFHYSEDNIESYAPSIADSHAVVVLKMVLDDPRRSFVFQLDEERLDRLISELIAAQRQLKVLVTR